MEERLLWKAAMPLVSMLFFISCADAADWNGQTYDTKLPPPDSLIDTVRSLIIEKGISEAYFDEHFTLKYANVDSFSADKGWQSASFIWQFDINDEYNIEYSADADKVDEGFVATDDYLVRDGVAYSFETKKLHEFGDLMPLPDAQAKLKECIKTRVDLRVPGIYQDGSLILSAETPSGSKLLVGTVNLETGDMTCKEESIVENAPGPINVTIETEPSSPLETYAVFGVIGIIAMAIVLFLIVRKKHKV